MQLRFRLNHHYQGQNAPFLYAVDSGLFRAAGIDVSFIEGFSSAQVGRALEADEADVGFGDVISVMEQGLRTGRASVRALMPIYVRSPCALGRRRDLVPLTLADVDGSTLCGPEGDMGARLLPIVLKVNGYGAARYDQLMVSPQERDRMVANREVLAATCFDSTLKFAMRMRGYEDSDLEFLYYADNGLDTYSGSLIAQAALLEKHPELVDTLRDITCRAWHDCADDPSLGVQSVVRRNSDLDASIVRDQLEWVMQHQVFVGSQFPFVYLPDSARWRMSRMVAVHTVTGLWEDTTAAQNIAKQVLVPSHGC